MTQIDTRYPTYILDIWSALKAEVVWLRGRWIIYCQLFGTSSERVDILNRSASTFFNVIQKTMLHDVQLSLSKLGDPAGSGARKNLTLDTLAGQLNRADEAELCAKLKPLIEEFDATCEKLRHRRNKWIPHFDLETMLKAKAKPLEGPSRNEIEASLAVLRELMNLVELHYTDSQTVYEHFIMNHDGDYLISTLKQGLR
jgi:hypothetical protein